MFSNVFSSVFGGASSGVSVVNAPRVSYNFTSMTSLPAEFTFTRSSNAWYFDSTGTYTQAAIDTPRFDYDPITLAPRGLMFENGKTNSIRNSTMQGAAAPNPLPTNWSFSGGGLGYTIIGLGTQYGLNYMDIQFSGTTSGTSLSLSFDTSIITSAGSTWTSSVYLARIAGSNTNISTLNIRTEFSGGSGAVSVNTLGTLDGTMRRYAATATAGTGSTNVVPRLTMGFTSGVAIDITLRIYAPQCELGSVVSSYIPTSTTAVTRNSDFISIQGSSFSNNFVNVGTAGSVIAWGEISGISSGSHTIWSISDGTQNDIVYTRIQNNGTYRGLLNNVTVTQFAVTSVGTTTGNTLFKLGMAWGSGTGYTTMNAESTTQGTPVLVPSTFNILKIGYNGVNSEPGLGWIRVFEYYPTRLSNSQINALTTL